MPWSPVKDIEIKKWSPLLRLRHSPVGRTGSLALLRKRSGGLLRQAKVLESISDDQLLQRAREFCAAAPSRGERAAAHDCSAFPLILEAIRRETSLVLHPNQVVAAIAMRTGSMVELATGEGKTLAALLAAAAYAMTQQSVHIITANDYLARRDSELAASVLQRLGLTAGWLDPKASPDDRRPLYRRRLLYATLHDIAFDWLRDRLTLSRGSGSPLQPPLRVALIDEADMVMIDEARTPMILSAPIADADTAERFYEWAQDTARRLKPEEDYDVVGPQQVALTPDADRRLSRGLPAEQAIEAKRAVLAMLRTRLFYRRNVNYIVQDEQVVIIDDKTGRPMPGRRWPDGLHEAVTVRENLPLEKPYRNVAQITVQQFLCQYERLCGCSGTMADAAREIWCVYGRPTLRVPTHRPCIRRTLPPLTYTTHAEQFQAVADQVRRLRDAGRSVLVGTTHISTSQRLSTMLEQMRVHHHVLNAFEEEQEAAIIARAGEPGAVTIATNMAGRGTDIKLDPAVAAAGGLHVISLQRHESARVDRQLIGRCTRQGDPGSTQFILCLQDPLLKHHAPDERLRFRPRDRAFGTPLDSRRLRLLWRNVQRQVEARHRETRVALIHRQKSTQQLLGQPDYLRSSPPPAPGEIAMVIHVPRRRLRMIP